MVPLDDLTNSLIKISRSVTSRALASNVTRLFLTRYESRTTKSPELIFSALLGDEGTHNVRFERALRT